MDQENKFPLWSRLPHAYPVMYSKGEFTLEPMMKGIYGEWKQGVGWWYDYVEKYYKENGKHPDWFQKLIDDDKANTNEENLDRNTETKQDKEEGKNQ